jgi:hypothetical protein
MSDDTELRSPEDRSRIGLTEDYERRYWTETLGVSENALRNAVQAVGISVADVREHLGK